MSQASQPSYVGDFPIASDAPAVERLQFIKRTYAHLTGAVVAFVALEFLLLQMPGIENIARSMLGGSWLIVLGLFMLVSWVANRWAHSDVSVGMQYAGLGLYVVAQAVIFIPLLYVAQHFGGPGVIPTAAIATLGIFGGLTGVVFMSKKDFSFLQPALCIGGLAALGCIVCGVIFGFSPGVFFTVAMIVLLSGFILYYTSNVLHHYRVGQHVAASLALFASLATLFWYVLQLALYLSNRE